MFSDSEIRVSRKATPEILDLLKQPSCNPSDIQATIGWITGRLRFGSCGWVRRVRYPEQTVAVKRLSLTPHDLDGLDYFEIFERIQQKGYHLATPLAATREIFVTEWQRWGTPPKPNKDYDSVPFNLYLQKLKSAADSLKSFVVTDKEWDVDCNPMNYLTRDSVSRDERDWYTAIDPVAAKSRFIR